jgi:uncharacterized membrane protein YkoI
MSTTKHRLTAAVSAGAISVAAVAGIADAATKRSSDAHASNEKALTGDTLKSASDAAIAANPGATVKRASTEDSAEGTGAAYEVKITKSDSTHAVVLEDSSFKVLSTNADRGHGGRGHGGPANEPALTGSDLTKAKAAALTAVPGGTVERAAAENSAEGTGAKYEVHVTKADGSEVEVLLDSSFGVIKTVADTHRHHGG